jgi:hypothetical protein
VIPTKDARIPEVFGYLAKVHPSVSCLVDGDAEGVRYVERLAAEPSPPRTIIRWPDGWRIEDLIAWIVAADAALLNNPEVAAAGFPNTLDRLAPTILESNLKTNEIAHTVLADAIAGSPRSMRRVEHVLDVLTKAVRGAAPETGVANVVRNANGVTMVWVFNDAVPGL